MHVLNAARFGRSVSGSVRHVGDALLIAAVGDIADDADEVFRFAIWPITGKRVAADTSTVTRRRQVLIEKIIFPDDQPLIFGFDRCGADLQFAGLQHDRAIDAEICRGAVEQQIAQIRCP